MTTSIRSRRLVLHLAGAAMLTGIAIAAADSPETPPIAAPTASPVGNWLAEDILGGGVIDIAQTTLDIAADGTVTGKGACNGYGGEATIKGERIAFGQLVATQMACPEAIMDQEMKFHDALSRTASFSIDEHGKLVLHDGAGEVLVRLVAQ